MNHSLSCSSKRGAQEADTGEIEIYDFRRRMWKHVQERRHTVLKVFPGRFAGADDGECMILGEATFLTKDGRSFDAKWTAHAVVSKVEGQYRFASYRVWIQNDQ